MSIVQGEGMEYFAGSGGGLRLRLRARRDGMTLMEGRTKLVAGVVGMTMLGEILERGWRKRHGVSGEKTMSGSGCSEWHYCSFAREEPRLESAG